MKSLYYRLKQEIGLLRRAFFRGEEQSRELKRLVEELEPFYSVRHTLSAYEKEDVKDIVEDIENLQKRIYQIIHHYGRIPRVRATIERLEERLQLNLT